MYNLFFFLFLKGKCSDILNKVIGGRPRENLCRKSSIKKNKVCSIQWGRGEKQWKEWICDRAGGLGLSCTGICS